MPPPKAPFFNRTPIDFRLPLVGFFDQAGAVTFLLSHVLGFRAEIERVHFIPDVVGAGAAATQAIRVRKGNAAGTILATITATLANHVMGAAGLDSGAVTAANEEASKLNDTDSISITKDAGTVFTAAGGTLRVWVRQKPQGRI